MWHRSRTGARTSWNEKRRNKKRSSHINSVENLEGAYSGPKWERGQTNETPEKMSITSRIRERITVRGPKRNIELHRCLGGKLINKTGWMKKILNMGYKETIRGERNLNPKKIVKRTKI
jgi:hypothetical protein